MVIVIVVVTGSRVDAKIIILRQVEMADGKSEQTSTSICSLPKFCKTSIL